MMRCLTPEWPAPSHVKAFTTTRSGGVSHPPYASLNLATHVGDNLNDVLANRKRLIETGVLPHEPFWLNQTHSTNVVEAQQSAALIIDADASYTTQTNTVCAVLTADCLPLLLCNRQGTLVSAIHAGWRGLLNGIIEATLNTLSLPPGDCLVWLGPAIGPTAFEVGSDVYQDFMNIDSAHQPYFLAIRQGFWFADLYALARYRLHKQGITHIYGGTYCTYTQDDLFYSFRRDNQTGRMATLIWMETL